MSIFNSEPYCISINSIGTKVLLCTLFILCIGNSYAKGNAAVGDSLDEQTLDSLRLTDDFVTASICIADPTDWQDDFLGVMGHAFIRLQCPTFDFDLCFSYESENAEEEMMRFLKGDLHMGMFRENTQEYIKPYQRWNRAVHEYTLNLPPEAKTRLWELMDNRVAEGYDLQMDLVRRGCTQTLVQIIEQALNGTPIEYGEWSDEYSLTRRQIVNNGLEPYPWIRFMLADLFLDNDFNENVANSDKIVYPVQLAEAGLKAKIEGKQMLEYKGDLVKAEPHEVERTWLTPVVVALCLLILSLLFAWFDKPYFDWVVLGLQFLLGVVLIWLAVVSDLPGSRGTHMLPLYNPLPLLLWRWRKYWALPYAVILAVWIIVVSVLPSMYVEPAHLIFAVTIIVVLVKNPVRVHLAKWRNKNG